IGIDGEGDALVDEDEVGAGAALLELGRLESAEALDDEMRMGMGPAGRAEKLVVGRAMRLVAREERGGVGVGRARLETGLLALSQHGAFLVGPEPGRANLWEDQMD